jgi:hypothetical protein
MKSSLEKIIEKVTYFISDEDRYVAFQSKNKVSQDYNDSSPLISRHLNMIAHDLTGKQF